MQSHCLVLATTLLLLLGNASTRAQNVAPSTKDSNRKGHIALFTGREALGASALFQDRSSQIGLGTLSPVAQFDVVTSGIGVQSTSSSPTASAIQGIATDETCFLEPCSAGVFGFAKSVVHNSGVYGVVAGNSGTGLNINNGAAVWGDTNVGVSAAIAVLGTADDNVAVAGLSNSEFSPTGEFINFNSSGSSVLYVAQASGNGYCNFDASGNMFCTGSKSAVVNVDQGRKIALYAVESPQNWFEDFGSASLVNGGAVVELDNVFSQTVTTGMNYHVFVTPNGDCRGLYVAQKTATRFEVRELGGGTSNLMFDYRIVAPRRGFESVRFADMTEMAARLAAQIPKRALSTDNQH